MDGPELARRVGVPVAFVERLVDLGILQPGDDGSFSKGDLFRVRLMRSSDKAGVPLEGIAQAIGEGRFTLSFLDMPHYRWSTLHDKTFADLARESGIPLDDLLNVEESQGRERPEPVDHVRQDVVDMVPLLQAATDAGLDEKSHSSDDSHLRRLPASSGRGGRLCLQDLLPAPFASCRTKAWGSGGAGQRLRSPPHRAPGTDASRHLSPAAGAGVDGEHDRN
jgi:hypothetical protein